MVRLTIDQQEVEVQAGTTLLAAARNLGVEIPVLCHLEGLPPSVSCMVCVVEETGSGRLLPACATPVAEGLQIVTGGDTVTVARRQALELLLSEHVGDCEGPCQQICPAHMDIPTMLRQIEQGDLHGAVVTIKQRIALPAVLGRICPAPCEKGCRRREVDQTVAICRLKGLAAEADLALEQPYRPVCRPASGKRVAIIGAGPAGLAAAYYLQQAGHACLLLDARAEAGGALREHLSEQALPRQLLDQEIARVLELGAELRLSTTVGEELSFASLRADHDAVVLTPGSIGGAALEAFGVAVGKDRVRVDGTSFATSLDGVFAGGAAVRPGRLAVRAVAHGWAIAVSVDQYLAGGAVTGPPRRLSSRLGKLQPGELAQLHRWAAELRGQPLDEAAAAGEPLTIAEAAAAAARCLDCACLAAEHCDLRRLGEQYQADPRHYRLAQRPMVERSGDHPLLLLEPGKCIRCGRCVRLTGVEQERLGLSFLGRGFAVRVGVPLGGNLDQALERAAERCCLACPTGALELRPRHCHGPR